VPLQLGGFGKIFAAVPPQKLLLAAPGVHDRDLSDPVPGVPAALVCLPQAPLHHRRGFRARSRANTTGAYGIYATLALGSALALFLYPHSLTGILSASSGHAIRRNAAMLPGYSLMLGLLALVGFFAIAAGVANHPDYADGFKQFGNNFAVPALFLQSFPAWFVGVAFAAIGIGALVPAAIMSIAAASLYTRNIHREFINRNPTDKQEAQMAKWASLIVKFGALVFIVFVPSQYAIGDEMFVLTRLPVFAFSHSPIRPRPMRRPINQEARKCTNLRTFSRRRFHHQMSSLKAGPVDSAPERRLGPWRR
jgi:solute:Na+ symporter, SSS family